MGNAQTPICPDSPLAAEWWEKGKVDTCPVYDMHGHMGTFRGIYLPRPEAEDMIHALDEAGVKLCCFSHHAALLSPDVGNRTAIEAVRRFPDRLRAYLAFNPHYPELMEQELATFDSLPDVYVGLKLHPGIHEVPVNDPRYERALSFANERGTLLLMHTWSNSRTDGPEVVRDVAAKYPRIRWLLGHSFNSDWDGAVAVARYHPNTWLELTSVSGVRGVLELFCEKVGSHRLLFGTDLPWFAEHQGIGSILSADITDEDRHNILHRNAEALLGMPATTPGRPSRGIDA